MASRRKLVVLAFYQLFSKHNRSLIRHYHGMPLRHDAFFPYHQFTADANDAPAEADTGGSGHLVQYSDSDAGHDSTGRIVQIE